MATAHFVENGFYWVILDGESSEWEIAQYRSDGKWWILGDDAAYSTDEFDKIDPTPVLRQTKD